MKVLQLNGKCDIIYFTIFNTEEEKRMNISKKRKVSSFDMYAFLILIAFEIMMSFAFLGYIHIPPISITFAYIPILMTACILGTVQSTVMGAIFGLASMYKATAFYTLTEDMMFSPFFSGNPFGSFVLAVVTRTVFGFLMGIVFKYAKAGKHPTVWMGFISLLAPLIHGFIVVAAVKVFFPNNVYSYFHSKYLMLGNAISAVICIGIVEILWKIYNQKELKSVKAAIDRASRIPYMNFGRKHIFVAVFATFVFGMTIAAAIYFSDRMSYMLGVHNVFVSAAIKGDLVHLQIQFMLAVFSLNIICIAVLNLGYRYAAYKNFLGELDAVTGVMGRRLFLNCCERAGRKSLCDEGWFLFFDIDYFKTVNDTFGHTAGDGVLKEIALILKSMFYDCGIIGRIGGDEFAVMVDKKILREDEIKKMLDEFLIKAAGVMPEIHKVSCSIGAYRFVFPSDILSLMSKTDTLLYKAKENGRACYVLGSCDEDI